MNSKTLLGIMLIIIATGLAGGAFLAAKTLNAAKLNPETLCPDKETGTITLILVDKTDPLTETEQIRVRNLVTAERDAVRRSDRIAVKLLTQEGGAKGVALYTVLDLCNPGAEANPFFENPKRVLARYETAFLEPIDAALASFSGEGSASASPIARSIELALDELHATPATHLKLVLVSDLMENGSDVSAYRGSLTERALHKLMPTGDSGGLKGAEVKIVLLSRPRYEVQQNAAVLAWRDFLTGATGRKPDIAQP